MKIGEFMECDTCRAKSGSPYLCQGCLHNRAIIELYEGTLEEILSPKRDTNEGPTNAEPSRCTDENITSIPSLSDTSEGRLYALYLEGRKRGDPESFIDYFKVRAFLLNEIGRAREEAIRDLEVNSAEYKKWANALRKEGAADTLERVRRVVEGIRKGADNNEKAGTFGGYVEYEELLQALKDEVV